MAASVLGKRQRGALQTEGTSASRLSHDRLLTALSSSYLAGTHLEQAPGSDAPDSPARRPAVGVVIPVIAVSGEE